MMITDHSRHIKVFNTDMRVGTGRLSGDFCAVRPAEADRYAGVNVPHRDALYHDDVNLSLAYLTYVVREQDAFPLV